MYTFICYPKCTTCQKAKQWLEDGGIEVRERHIKEDRPTKEELRMWYEKSGLDIKKFFNTSGILYKELELKEKLPNMTIEEKLELLSTDGMLVKRPILVTDDQILFGFSPENWKKALV